MFSGVILVSCNASIAGLCISRHCFAVSMFVAPCMFQLIIFELSCSFLPCSISVADGNISLFVVSNICLNSEVPAMVFCLCKGASVR